MKPDGQNSVISFVISKWLLPELSNPAQARRIVGSGDENAPALEWFRVLRPLGAFVLVFLEARIKSTCISNNSFCLFSIKQCIHLP